MAIAIEQVDSAISGADPTLSLTVSSGDILVACIGIHQGTVIDVDWNGTSLTQGPNATTAFNERAEIWYDLTPETGTHTLTFDGTGGGGKFICGYVLSGVKTTGQPDQSNTAIGSSTESSVSITPSSNNSLIIDCHYSEGDFTTVGADQIERANLQDQSFENGASSTTLQTTAGAETMSWTINSGQRWAVAVISFEEAAAASNTRRYSLSTLGVG